MVEVLKGFPMNVKEFTVLQSRVTSYLSFVMMTHYIMMSVLITVNETSYNTKKFSIVVYLLFIA